MSTANGLFCRIRRPSSLKSSSAASTVGNPLRTITSHSVSATTKTASAAAANPKHTTIDRQETAWRVRQVLLDSEDDNDWFFEATIDLDRSRAAARPVLTLERFAR